MNNKVREYLIETARAKDKFVFYSDIVKFVIEGLGNLRNKLGDAYGINIVKARPAHRHAALAVIPSGSICSFLLQTYLHLHQKTKKETER